MRWLKGPEAALLTPAVPDAPQLLCASSFLKLIPAFVIWTTLPKVSGIQFHVVLPLTSFYIYSVSHFSCFLWVS